MTHPALTPTAADKHSKQLAALVRALEMDGLVTDTLSLGKTKFMVSNKLSLSHSIAKHPVKRSELCLPANAYARN